MERATPDVFPLVINADDFGLTEGVCRGIVHAIHAGLVTSTTAMVCVEGAADRLEQWGREIQGRIGAHLQLTTGRPILKASRIPSLVSPNGDFPVNKKVFGNPEHDEVIEEWHAQLGALRDAKITPTHIDTHHHIHKHPHVFPAFLEIAQYYKLPARAIDPGMAVQLREAGVTCLDTTLLDWFGGDLSPNRLIEILENGTRTLTPMFGVELMCHPGFVDGPLARLSRYVEDRETELATLTDPNLLRELAGRRFHLTGWGDLLAAHPVST